MRFVINGTQQSRYCLYKLSKHPKIYTTVLAHQKTLLTEIFKFPFTYKPLVHFPKNKLSCQPITTPTHLNLLTFVPSYPNSAQNISINKKTYIVCCQIKIKEIIITVL